MGGAGRQGLPVAGNTNGAAVLLWWLIHTDGTDGERRSLVHTQYTDVDFDEWEPE